MKEITDIKSIATPEQWNDWHWQLKNRITSPDELKKYIHLLPEEEEVFKSQMEDGSMGIAFQQQITMH